MENNKLETAIFGAGCFWCIEAIYKSLKGVEEVLPGYIGGKKKTLPMKRCVQEKLAMQR